MTDIIKLAADLRKNLEKLGDFLVEELAAELVAQGHRATGRLAGSVEAAVKEYREGISLEISYLEYGRYVNDGVKAERVPFGRKTGAKTSKYIEALIKWVQIKGLATGLEAKGLAFGIARKHKKEGIPTRGSYAFSRNGRRVGFQNYILSQNIDEVDRIVQSGLNEAVSAQLDIIIGNITK